MSDRFARLALTAALVAALCLAACGRKSGLEAPPTAALGSPPPAAPRPSLGEPAHVGLEGEAQPAPPQPPPARKSFLLDWLLN